MGRGDIRSKKGKISAGSFGNSRPHKPAKKTTAQPANTETSVSSESPKKKGKSTKA